MSSSVTWGNRTLRPQTVDVGCCHYLCNLGKTISKPLPTTVTLRSVIANNFDFHCHHLWRNPPFQASALSSSLISDNGRTRELALLDQMYSKSGARMFLLYGRRRVGKTELLKHWVQSRKYPTLYWQAELFPSKIQLSQFSQVIQQYRFPGQAVTPDFTFGSWEQAFLEIGQLARTARLVLVLGQLHTR